MATIITGVVLHETEWTPLPNVTVYAYSTNGYTEGSDTTDSNGRFLISDLTDREWLAKLPANQAGRVLLVPTDVTPPAHALTLGQTPDDHHSQAHLSAHHTGGDDALSLELLAGTIVGAGHGDQTGEALAIHAPTDLVGGNWKVPYSDGSGNVQELALGADGLVLVSAGAAAAPVFEAIYITHVAEFPALSEDLATGVMGGRPGKCVGESGEHGTFTAIRAKAVAGTAGTGTTTILIEADDNPAFSSAVTLYTLALNTSTEVDDTVLDTAWAAGDIWVRARCTAVGATAPKDVNVFMYWKERAEAF
jgi:hypothetical protein